MLLLSCVSLLVLLGAAPTHARNCDPDLGFATRRSDGSGNFSRGTPTINNEYTYTTVIPDTQMTMVIFIITHSVMEKRDIMMTLNLANEQVVEKDQNKPLPNEYYWKLKARGSESVFKLRRVEHQSAIWRNGTQIVRTLIDFFNEHSRTFVTQYKVCDDADIHLVYGCIREKYWWEHGEIIEPKVKGYPLSGSGSATNGTMVDEDGDYDDGYGGWMDHETLAKQEGIGEESSIPPPPKPPPPRTSTSSIDSMTGSGGGIQPELKTAFTGAVVYQ